MPSGGSRPLPFRQLFRSAGGGQRSDFPILPDLQGEEHQSYYSFDPMESVMEIPGSNQYTKQTSAAELCGSTLPRLPIPKE